jgi:CMP-N-acetylneuraminic acid synthetase
MQPTSPFRSKSELVEIREILAVAKDERTSLVSMTKVEDSHPARMYRVTRRSRAKRLRGFRNDYHKRRQDLPPVYIRDGGIYFIGAKLVRDKLQYSKTPTVYSRQFPWSLNIDSEIDLLAAQNVPREQVAQDPAS